MAMMRAGAETYVQRGDDYKARLTEEIRTEALKAVEMQHA